MDIGECHQNKQAKSLWQFQPQTFQTCKHIGKFINYFSIYIYAKHYIIWSTHILNKLAVKPNESNIILVNGQKHSLTHTRTYCTPKIASDFDFETANDNDNSNLISQNHSVENDVEHQISSAFDSST